ncbi:leucine-rich repeat-containing protein 42 [Ascaphus truei]|uniref:leucine-rich repeat-containing protein 42 n=1 Tax=Ascaphus truei TaxID=8439 RepID=UPI003F5A162A
MSQSSEDTGQIYVRENGQLRLAGSHSAPLRARPCGLFMVELCVKQEDTHRQREKHFIFTYTERGSLRYSAKSLFSLALDLIADNIQHVDSLLGFPEQIADKLFTAAEARHKFHEPCSGLAALRKFTDAYGELVLSSLCLRGRYLLVSERLEEIKSFQGLRCLDLSCCKLGDEHELLGHLTTGAMNSLNELYLKDNCLSDAGIRRMTAPLRVLHRGLGSLTVLDLSCNPNITDLGVTFLFAFKQLQFLDVSGTGVQDPRVTIHRILTRSGLRHSKEPLPQFNHAGCRTQGWAEQVLHQWANSIIQAAKPKEALKSRKVAQQFYGKEKRINHQVSETCHMQNPQGQTHKHLQFYRQEGQEPQSQQRALVSSNPGPSSHKRSCDDQAQEVVPPTPSAKRQCVTLTAADWNLLNTY